ncbi:hypothetical protein DFQ28_003251 [Apophysomyces sp. BC1034]|nr:hypothetical protein DFQ30_009230 [Apophysomyces sp. BC1015]KAG0179571.1 hypothetical protein DFQ29_001921 [Apophysomyces sp. BC1021]KAG0189579.1 hypothetical protein DFQ28_003251 [Apophysomyces sp. BC1034]
MVSMEKIITRVTETRWSKLYMATAVLQCIFIVTLQAIICSQNSIQAATLTGNRKLADAMKTAGDSPVEIIALSAADRLGRIKWENIAFIGFQVWFAVMALDATVYQNTAEILALAIMNILCAVLGALEVVDGVKWLGRLKVYPQLDSQPLMIAEKIEIALSVVILLFACAMTYLSYEMSRQFGWNIYKKIGADVQIQRMYRMFQFFVLALKLDVFTEFLVSVFYLIQFALKQGINWESGIQIVVTLLMLPMLYFARAAGSSESPGKMVIFITFEIIVLVHYALILYQTFKSEDLFPTFNTNDRWYTWICLVWLGVIIDVATAVLGYLCMRSFDRGLKPFVQRGAANKNKHDLELSKTYTGNSWRIDDD